VIALASHERVAPLVVKYLNRLSDLLFVMARVANRRADVEEPQWKGRER
jgi:cob(I)alamin adenosyltransferase